MDINQIIEQHALWLESDGEEGFRADLSRVSLSGADLSRANLYEANLDGADLSRVSLSGANLTRANLYEANLTRANLSLADLSGADLSGANLSGANLTRASLSGADLTRANLYEANLTRANLTRANLYEANLTRANLYEANLYGASLYEADLDGTSGNLNHLKSIFCETYPVTYTAEVIQIGCQRHKLEDWWSFDDARILEMDGKKALKWWRTWKPILQQIIATSPAIATGARDMTTEADRSVPVECWIGQEMRRYMVP